MIGIHFTPQEAREIRVHLQAATWPVVDESSIPFLHDVEIKRNEVTRKLKPGKTGCSCTLCGMIADKLENGEASQIGDMEDYELEHLDHYQFDESALDHHPLPSKRRS